MYNVGWNSGKTDFIWDENIDGFSFWVDFSVWDFTKIDQEITLSRAK